MTASELAIHGARAYVTSCVLRDSILSEQDGLSVAMLLPAFTKCEATATQASTVAAIEASNVYEELQLIVRDYRKRVPRVW